MGGREPHILVCSAQAIGLPYREAGGKGTGWGIVLRHRRVERVDGIGGCDSKTPCQIASA
ncbi:hypothetical protein PSAC2689_20615 [Paraburkholderia sacchari]